MTDHPRVAITGSGSFLPDQVLTCSLSVKVIIVSLLVFVLRVV